MSAIIIATTGEYSDYAVDGVFNVLHPFTLAKVVAACLAYHQLQGSEGEPSPRDLIAYLLSSGYVEVADHEEVHFGDYSRITLSDEALVKEWKP